MKCPFQSGRGIGPGWGSGGRCSKTGVFRWRAEIGQAKRAGCKGRQLLEAEGRACVRPGGDAFSEAGRWWVVTDKPG